ncbi:uncharacterized protein F5891DRAFT_1256601 [Suillus fuscotomentosus]|uniref:Cell wall alpha-1,3-glucan synthase Mok11-14/Ags1-like transmembrane domain-containing protein n=1 Tax=Suillus fuscotomentosus TaxID=1912939 RepID=A0AAD4HF92_9AGAM|nr:uncharacterized protein F5891DRAFT_1256601 [Suillus fuscotomentosus]KAG1894026.1 hypothetical protein F5891DRAFT_1256601 [Suillus fuscotomentosus]
MDCQPYGRNWSFLWNVSIPKWAILLLIIFFFVGVWVLMFYILTSLSKTHTWLLPVFAVGLGAPRWCQGVGLGMILLQTLSRLHVCSALALAQVIGSICVMAARATASNRIGPGSVFPDVGTWDFSHGLKGSPMASAPFWLALTCQTVIVLGYF